MPSQHPAVFALPGHLARNATPALIAADERHITAIAGALASRLTGLSARLEARRDPGGRGA